LSDTDSNGLRRARLRVIKATGRNKQWRETASAPKGRQLRTVCCVNYLRQLGFERPDHVCDARRGGPAWSCWPRGRDPGDHHSARWPSLQQL